MAIVTQLQIIQCVASIHGDQNENYITVMDKKRAYTVKDHIYKALLYEVIDERTFTYNMGIGTDPPLCCTIAIARCQEQLVPSIR